MTNQTQTQTSLRTTLRGDVADAVRHAAAHDRRSVALFLDVHLKTIPEVAAALSLLASRSRSQDDNGAN